MSENNREKLNADEKRKFRKATTFPTYIAQQQADERVKNISENLLIKLIELAKFETGRNFGGALAKTNELGYAPIQPWFMGASNTWRNTYGSTGWNDYEGHPLNNVTVRPKTWVGYWGWEDREPLPKITRLKETIGNETLIIQYLYDILYARGHRAMAPEPVTIHPKSTYQLEFYVDQTGYSELKPAGWGVTIGSNLAKKSYYDT